MDGNKAYGPHEAVMLGIDLEDAGYNFYTRVADVASDQRVRDLFLFLADAEAEHKRIIHDEIEPLFSPEWYREEDELLMKDYLKKVEHQPVFPEPDEAMAYARTAVDVCKAVDIGIKAEERARDYFAFLRDSTQDEKGRQAFHRLHLEEIKHLHMLQELRKEL